MIYDSVIGVMCTLKCHPPPPPHKCLALSLVGGGTGGLLRWHPRWPPLSVQLLWVKPRMLGMTQLSHCRPRPHDPDRRQARVCSYDGRNSVSALQDLQLTTFCNLLVGNPAFPSVKEGLKAQAPPLSDITWWASLPVLWTISTFQMHR